MGKSVTNPKKGLICQGKPLSQTGDGEVAEWSKARPC